MLKISDAIQEILESNVLFSQGIQEGIVNLSQLARHIHPLVEARVQKEVEVSAITMNLSRMAKRIVTIKKNQNFQLKRIHVHSHLSVVTYNNSSDLEEQLHTCFGKLKKNNAYMTLSQGEHETTCIIDSEYIEVFKSIIDQKPKSLTHEVSAIGVTFDEQYFHIPGLLSQVLHTLEQQGINIVELASTFTELTLYIHSQDRTLCFDTLQRKFF